MIGADRSASPPGFVTYSKLHECLHVLPNALVTMRETSKQDVTIIHDMCPILPLW